MLLMMLNNTEQLKCQVDYASCFTTVGHLLLLE